MGNLIIFVWAIRLTWFFLTGDTRTWKSLLTHAYDGTTHAAKGGKKVDMDKIRTMKDEIIARDKGMYDARSGHLTRDPKAHSHDR